MPKDRQSFTEELGRYSSWLSRQPRKILGRYAGKFVAISETEKGIQILGNAYDVESLLENPRVRKLREENPITPVLYAFVSKARISSASA